MPDIISSRKRIQNIEPEHRQSRCVRFCTLASGSKGNSVYISDDTTSILVDAGLSGKELQKRLESRGINCKSLDAILLTHEHNDHTQGVGVLARRFGLPVFSSPKTTQALAINTKDVRFHPFTCGSAFSIGTLSIHPFSTSHDAVDPAGFTLQSRGIKIGIATDTGTATSVIAYHLRGCRAILLEANHDPRMLMEGPYPWPLKQRIRSRCGHLSNEDARDLLAGILHEKLTHVLLGHLSETNNLPEKALGVIGPVMHNHPGRLIVAGPHEAGELFVLE